MPTMKAGKGANGGKFIGFVHGNLEPGDDDGDVPEDPARLHFPPKLDLMPSDSTSGGGAVDPNWIIGRVCEPGDEGSGSMAVAAPTFAREIYGGGAGGDPGGGP